MVGWLIIMSGLLKDAPVFVPSTRVNGGSILCFYSDLKWTSSCTSSTPERPPDSATPELFPNTWKLKTS